MQDIYLFDVDDITEGKPLADMMAVVKGSDNNKSSRDQTDHQATLT
jgi:hypothetical protein